MRKKIVSILVAVAFLIPLVLVAKSVTVKKIGSKKSAVTFNHTKHKRYKMNGKKVTCKTCHHKGKVRDKCGKCHKGVKGKNAIHKNCYKQCHIPQKKGPRRCNQCHK